MGQYWHVVDLDLVCHVTGSGKLGEWIFDDQGGLVKAITKPTLADLPSRPGPPITYRYWELPCASAGKLAQVPTTTVQLIFNHIARSSDAVAFASTCQSLWTQGNEQLRARFWESKRLEDLNKSAGLFGKLPSELIDMVFNHLDSFRDAFLLGLTCAYMWLGGEACIIRLLIDSKAPGAGHRMMTIGDYTKDFPKTLCKPEYFDAIVHRLKLRGAQDLEDLAYGTYDINAFASYNSYSTDEDDDNSSQTQIDWEYLSEDSDNDNFSSSSQPSTAPGGNLDRDKRRHCAQEQRRGLAHGVYHLCTGYPDNDDPGDLLYKAAWGDQVPGASEWAHAYFLWKPSFSSSVDNDPNTNAKGGIHILRNISKQLYMRSDNPLAKRDEYCGFGRALIAQICWSADDTNLAYDGPIHRGPWAGDQFDIIPFDLSGPEARTWKNVTADLLSDLRKIYEPENNWRRICDEKDDVSNGGG